MADKKDTTTGGRASRGLPPTGAPTPGAPAPTPATPAYEPVHFFMISDARLGGRTS